MSIGRENRACLNPSCNGDVEQENHFLLSCKIDNEVRKKFLRLLFTLRFLCMGSVQIAKFKGIITIMGVADLL